MSAQPAGFFRCPHCKQKTITAWAKLRTRGECPACGGRFVASAWGVLLASLVTPLAVFVPVLLFTHVGPMSLPLLWGSYAVGALLSMALAAGVYLLVTPLWRRGTALARWDAIAFFTLIAALLVAGLEYSDFSREAGFTDEGTLRIGAPLFTRTGPDGIVASVNYGNARAQQAFKDALDKAGIKYQLETREGKEFVAWTRAQDAAVREIQKKVDGEGLRPGRNASFDDTETQDAFVAWLAQKGIKHEVIEVRGRKFVTWEGPDDLTMQFMRERAPHCGKRAAAAAGKCG